MVFRDDTAAGGTTDAHPYSSGSTTWPSIAVTTADETHNPLLTGPSFTLNERPLDVPYFGTRYIPAGTKFEVDLECRILIPPTGRMNLNMKMYTTDHSTHPAEEELTELFDNVVQGFHNKQVSIAISQSRNVARAYATLVQKCQELQDQISRGETLETTQIAVEYAGADLAQAYREHLRDRKADLEASFTNAFRQGNWYTLAGTGTSLTVLFGGELYVSVDVSGSVS